MDDSRAIEALAALAQPTRLAAFRHIVAQGPTGLPAGEVARHLAVPQNTLSSHLAQLARAGLVHADRQGRSIIYRADIDQMRAVMDHLVNQCCGGHPELCAPQIADMTCCSAKAADHG